MKSETLIVGFGSSHGDDQFGWRVAEQLSALAEHSSVTVRQARSPAEILGWLEGVERLIVCDACQDLGLPGRMHHWRWPDAALAELRFAGSHDLGVSAALGLADRLGFCRQKCRSGVPKALLSVRADQCPQPWRQRSPKWSAAFKMN